MDSCKTRDCACGRDLGAAASDYPLGPGHCVAEVPVRNSVRDFRAQQNWTQADLAEKLGVSRQTVNAIETEKYDPSLPLAFKIAKVFRRPVEEVFRA